MLKVLQILSLLMISAMMSGSNIDPRYTTPPRRNPDNIPASLSIAQARRLAELARRDARNGQPVGATPRNLLNEFNQINGNPPATLDQIFANMNLNNNNNNGNPPQQ
jgi:hypothetical protein